MGIFSRFAGSFVKERVSNTKNALQLIIEDFKRYILILKYVFLACSVGTIVYSLAAGVGNDVINYSLLGLLFVYTVLDAILKRRENPDPSKKLRVIYAWIKIVLNALALLSSLYAIYSGANQTKPLSIVFATISLIMFVLKVLVEICLDVFSSKWRLLKTGMALDANEHPNTAGKLFSPLVGDIVDIEGLKESDVKRIKGE